MYINIYIYIYEYLFIHALKHVSRFKTTKDVIPRCPLQDWKPISKKLGSTDSLQESQPLPAAASQQLGPIEDEPAPESQQPVDFMRTDASIPADAGMSLAEIQQELSTLFDKAVEEKSPHLTPHGPDVANEEIGKIISEDSQLMAESVIHGIAEPMAELDAYNAPPVESGFITMTYPDSQPLFGHEDCKLYVQTLPEIYIAHVSFTTIYIYINTYSYIYIVLLPIKHFIYKEFEEQMVFVFFSLICNYWQNIRGCGFEDYHPFRRMISLFSLTMKRTRHWSPICLMQFWHRWNNWCWNLDGYCCALYFFKFQSTYLLVLQTQDKCYFPWPLVYSNHKNLL